MENTFLPRPILTRRDRFRLWVRERNFRAGVLLGALGPLLMVALPALAQLTTPGSGVRIWDGAGNFAVLTNTTPGGSDYGLVVRMAGAAAGGTSSNFGAAFPGAGTAAGFSDGTNMREGRAADLDTGAGAVYGQLVNLVKRASGGPVEFGTSTDPVRTDPTGTTPQPVTQSTSPWVSSLSQTGSANDVDVATMPSSATANNDGGTVSLTTSSATVLASFSTRKFAAICSLPDNTDKVYLRLAATAGTGDLPLYQGQCFNISNTQPYTGIIDGRSASGTQVVSVVEW